MPSALHQQTIAQLCAGDPAFQTRLFMKALYSLVDEHGPHNYPRVIPDVYRINGDVIEAYEVIVTSEIEPGKLGIYTEIWFHLDCDEVELRLIQVWPSPVGVRLEPVDLASLWWERQR